MTTLTINRLAPREVTVLIERVAGSRPLAENIRRRIVERSDGIPLFVEEMTKAVLEAEEEGGGAHARVNPVEGARRPRQPPRFADGGSTVSDQPRAWPRLERRLGGSFLMLCWRS